MCRGGGRVDEGAERRREKKERREHKSKRKTKREKERRERKASKRAKGGDSPPRKSLVQLREERGTFPSATALAIYLSIAAAA